MNEKLAKVQDLEQDRNSDQEIIEVLEEKLKEAEEKCEKIQSLKIQVETLTENNKEQNKLLSELRFELAQGEDLKDELEAKIKELESSDSNEFVKKIREKMAAQTIGKIQLFNLSLFTNQFIFCLLL